MSMVSLIVICWNTLTWDKQDHGTTRMAIERTWYETRRTDMANWANSKKDKRAGIVGRNGGFPLYRALDHSDKAYSEIR